MKNSEIFDEKESEIERLIHKIKELEKEMEEYRRAELMAKDESSRLVFRLKSLEKQLDNCLTVEENLKATLYDQMTASLAHLEATIRSERAGYIDSLLNRLSESDAACRERDIQLARIYTSVSWKVTKPLRFFRRLVSRVFASR